MVLQLPHAAKFVLQHEGVLGFYCGLLTAAALTTPLDVLKTCIMLNLSVSPCCEY